MSHVARWRDVRLVRNRNATKGLKAFIPVKLDRHDRPAHEPVNRVAGKDLIMPSVKRPTIADIALRAGVTKAAVSYALNGRRGVSEATRRRIVGIATELGWQ